MSNCYDSHEAWMAAVATGECTISLTEFHDNVLAQQDLSSLVEQEKQEQIHRAAFNQLEELAKRTNRNRRNGKPPRRE